MNYLADPGGRFASDTHRRVLASLPHPDDEYGWTVSALHARMVPDAGTNLQSTDEVEAVLRDLQNDGHAEEIPVTMANQENRNVWRQTPEGFDVLNGPIANEPPPGAEVQGPANIGVASQSAATRLDGSFAPPPAPTADEQAQEAPQTTQEGQADAASDPAR